MSAIKADAMNILEDNLKFKTKFSLKDLLLSFKRWMISNTISRHIKLNRTNSKKNKEVLSE